MTIITANGIKSNVQKRKNLKEKSIIKEKTLTAEKCAEVVGAGVKDNLNKNVKVLRKQWPESH